jgi:hydrogenase expression/formation protein HypC
MCHAIPVRIRERNGDQGVGERDGLEIDIDLSLLPEAKVGDQVIVHVGIALSQITDDEDETVYSESVDVNN